MTLDCVSTVSETVVFWVNPLLAHDLLQIPSSSHETGKKKAMKSRSKPHVSQVSPSDKIRLILISILIQTSKLPPKQYPPTKSIPPKQKKLGHPSLFVPNSHENPSKLHTFHPILQSLMAYTAALAFKVSDTMSRSSRWTPPSTKPRTFTKSDSNSWNRSTPRRKLRGMGFVCVVVMVCFF